MKKKILVPIMALAMIVFAGVNFNMNILSEDNSLLSLASLVKLPFANAEDTAPGGEQDGTIVACSNCGSQSCDGGDCLPSYTEVDGISGCFGSSIGC